jgi:ABC-type glycerol-3-phosphate transport system substrate-binding protein
MRKGAIAMTRPFAISGLKRTVGASLILTSLTLGLAPGLRTAKAAPVVVDYFSSAPAARMMPLITAFNKANPGIQVKFSTLPFNQFFQQVEIRLSAGATDPDVLDVDAPEVAGYAVQGFLQPLDSAFSKADIAQFIPATLNSGRYQGHLLAPPLNSSSQVLYYNKDLLSKAGIPFPPNDVNKRLTWEQVTADAEKAQVKSGSQVTAWGLVIEQIDRPYQLLPLAESYGGQAISKDGLTATGYVNSPAWIKAFTWYYNTFNTWNISPKSATDATTDGLFPAGKAAFFWGGPWNVPTYRTTKGLNWGFAPTPYFAGGKPVTPNDSWHIGVNLHSKNIAAAETFVHWLTVGPGQDMWENGSGNVPTLKRTAAQIQNNPAYAKFPDNVLRLTSYEAGHTAIARPVTPGFDQYQNFLTNAFNNMRSGQSPKAALDAAASQIDRALAKYR